MSDPKQPIVLPPGSGPGGTPSNVRQPRTQRIGDTFVSIVLLMAALAAYFIGLVFSVLTLTFADSCGPTCNVAGAVGAQSATAIILAAVLLLGGIATLVFAFGLKRRAWPIAVGTIIALLLGWVIGAIVFFATLSS
jgi:hypothetical protein